MIDHESLPQGHRLGALSETGHAAILYPGLTAALHYIRAMTPGPHRPRAHKRLGLFGRREPRVRWETLNDLADLVHNWPEILSGSNRVHTADDVAGDIQMFLSWSQNVDPADPHDQALKSSLEQVHHQLLTLGKPPEISK